MLILARLCYGHMRISLPNTKKEKICQKNSAPLQTLTIWIFEHAALYSLSKPSNDTPQYPG